LLLCLPVVLAQLSVSQLSGFSAGKRAVTVQLSGTSNTNIVLCTYLQGLGYSVTSGRRTVNVVLANGTVIGSAASSTPLVSFETGNCGGAWSTWNVKIIVRGTDTARIQGHGGLGGAGEVDTGCDWWGSGGGGAGSAPGLSNTAGTAACGLFPATNPGDPGTATAGGAPGTGEVTNSGTTSTIPAEAGHAGGTALRATTGGPNITLEPEASATLQIWAGGGGGGGGAGTSASGGTGGGPGLPGGDAAFGVGAAGGSAGVKYSTPGAATITEVGPGTIDDRGL